MNIYKHIHFVGIKGVGMTPLAIIAKESGAKVTGSDLDQSFITDEPLAKAGIEIFNGFLKDNVIGANLIIFTGAHGGADNIEVIEGKKIGTPVLTQGQAVGVFMKGDLFKRKFKGIAVSGTHGKTTTTAIIATILSQNKLDPSYIIGTSMISSLPFPGHFGKGEYFIAEADEYVSDPRHDKTPKLLLQSPQIAVIANIELDHTDIYSSIDEIRTVFLQFANKLPKEGTLVANFDDEQTKMLLKEYTGNVITFGQSAQSDVVITRITPSSEKTFFTLERGGISLGDFSIPLFGTHNISNATAAYIVATEAGLSSEQIKLALSTFKGSKRRLEYLGNLPSGAKWYDDYAHHPTEIQKSLKALKDANSSSHIVCIFQPHTYSRTKDLFTKFSTCFSKADTVIFTEIFPSEREDIDTSFSASHLASEVRKTHKSVIFLKSSADVVEYISKQDYSYSTIVVTMGAGDVYKIAEQFSLHKT